MEPKIIVDELGSYPSVERTSSGGWAVAATLTRTGLFKYVEGGKTITVLRPADEVFADESLASLAHCPVTVYHPVEREVTPKNFRRVVVGHLDRPTTLGGKYVAGRLRIEDEETGNKIDARELCEVSLGYRADYALNPDGSFVTGTFDGQTYDRVQKNIRYNHVSLGPKGWGRAGADVGIKLDGVNDYVGVMNLAADQTINDAADVTVPPVVTPPAPAVTAPVVVVDQAAFDRLQAQTDILQLQLAEALKKAATPSAPIVDSAAVAARAELVAKAKVLAPTLACDGLTDAEVKSLALAATMKVDGKSAEYIDAAFDIQVAHRKVVVDSHMQIGTQAAAKVVDSAPDPLAEAYAKNVAAYKPSPATATA